MCHNYEWTIKIVKTSKQKDLEKSIKKENKEQGKTCLTCLNTRQAVGPMLLCDIDSKLKKLDDSCGKYRSISFGVRVSSY